MAVAAFTQGLDVLQRRICRQYGQAADPAGDHAMQLAGHGFVNFVAGQSQSAHAESLADARAGFCLSIKEAARAAAHH